jgi:hypothetical protein
VNVDDERAIRLRAALTAHQRAVPPTLLGAIAARTAEIEPTQRTVGARLAVFAFQLAAIVGVSAVAFLATQLLYSGPVTETTRSGDFELTVRIEQGRYLAGERVEVIAELSYIGPEDFAVVSGGDIISFAMEDDVGHRVPLSPWVRDMCSHVALQRGVPLVHTFEPKGYWPYGPDHGPVPEPAYRGSTPEPGTWKAFAVADFRRGWTCSGEPIRLEASVRYVVLPPQPIRDSASAGGYTLTLTIPRSSYREGEPIGAVATLTYGGPKDEVNVVHGYGGPLGFGVAATDGRRVSPGWRDSCEVTVLTRGVPLTVPFQISGGFTSDDPNIEFFHEYFADPAALTLPAGTWQIWVETGIRPDAACGDAAQTLRLVASGAVVVQP